MSIKIFHINGEHSHTFENVSFRYAMHYVNTNEGIGAGVNLLLDYIFDIANGNTVGVPEDAENLLQQLGYTLEEIHNVNKI